MHWCVVNSVVSGSWQSGGPGASAHPCHRPNSWLVLYSISALTSLSLPRWWTLCYIYMLRCVIILIGQHVLYRHMYNLRWRNQNKILVPLLTPSIEILSITCHRSTIYLLAVVVEQISDKGFHHRNGAAPISNIL